MKNKIEEVIYLDSVFDDAIIGVPFGKSFVVYNGHKIIGKLIDLGLSELDAKQEFEYNFLNNIYKNAPIYIKD